MVDTSEVIESKYLNADLVKASPTKTLMVLSEGEYEKTDFGRKLVLGVMIDQKPKNWRVNRLSAQALSDAYGKDTKNWIGKRAKVDIENIKGKETIIAKPHPEDLLKQ